MALGKDKAYEVKHKQPFQSVGWCERMRTNLQLCIVQFDASLRTRREKVSEKLQRSAITRADSVLLA